MERGLGGVGRGWPQGSDINVRCGAWPWGQGQGKDQEYVVGAGQHGQGLKGQTQGTRPSMPGRKVSRGLGKDHNIKGQMRGIGQGHEGKAIKASPTEQGMEHQVATR